MKKILTLFAIAAASCLLPISAWAQEAPAATGESAAVQQAEATEEVGADTYEYPSLAGTSTYDAGEYKLFYRILEDDTVEIVTTTNSSDWWHINTLEIPAYIEGRPVTSIGEQAFAQIQTGPDTDDNKTEWEIYRNWKGIELILPDTLRHIGMNAFAYFPGRGDLVIPRNVEYIDAYAFTVSRFEEKLIICSDKLKQFGSNYVFNGETFYHDAALLPDSGYKAVYLPPNLPRITYGEAGELIQGEATFGISYVYYVEPGSQADSEIRKYSKYVDVRPASEFPWSEVTQADGMVEFVKRLYETCLSREADTAGLNYWVGRLFLKEITGADAAVGFVFSDEFMAKNYCNEHYVTQLYRAFMGREPDEGGLQYWVSKLEGGATREEVFNGFVGSTEFDAICKTYKIERGNGLPIPTYGTVPTGACSVCGKQDGVTGFVTRMYKVALDREPDAAGLKDWTNRLWAHTASGTDIGLGFIFSEEFTNKAYNNADYVERLYEAFMGRASDAAGKADWVGKLDGGTSRLDVFNGFAASQEFTNICNSYGIVRG